MRKLMLAVAALSATVAAYAAGLPSGYMSLDYVESDGNQWVDVGLKLKNTYQVEMDFLVKSLNSSTLIFGARDTAKSKNFASC